MYPKYVFGFVASLTLLLSGCGGGGSSDSGDVSHGDTPTLAITAGNALGIAAEVYRVAAVDVPYTASVAMVSGSNTVINSAACVDPNTIGSGSSGGMMGTGMMDMVFTNCQLATTPLNSAHTLTVNGTCSNSVSSVSATIETVIGNEITFTTAGATMRLHAFLVTRDSDDMSNASGTLHGVAGSDANILMFNTPTAFTGSAMVPTAGQLLVTGANNSRLRLTVVDGGTDFTLAVDADGDGVYEYSQSPTQQNWNNVFWLPLIP
jgi:predicted RecA/RadA family phage recombinase